MRSQVRALTIAIGLFCAASAFAQTAAPVAAKASAPAAVTAPSAAPTAKPTLTSVTKLDVPAAGGGDSKVWVNTKSKVYHCEGSKSYAKTQGGEYMTEADAKAKGNHADHGKVCTK